VQVLPRRSVGPGRVHNAERDPPHQGRVKDKVVLAAHPRPSFAHHHPAKRFRHPAQEPREAERRKAHPTMSARRNQMLPPESASGAEAAQRRGRSPSGAPPRRLSERPNAPTQPRPRFARAGGRRALPAPPIALKRSTPRPGRGAGGDDALTARRRGDEPRPQEPHPLHQSIVTG
jgi:hypothetical protein